MSARVIAAIDAAFADAPPLTDAQGDELSAHACNLMVQEGEQFLFGPVDWLGWVIARAMRDVLRSDYASDMFCGLPDLLDALNVERSYSERDYLELEAMARRHGHVDDSREVDRRLAPGRRLAFAAFTPPQAAAIVEFLEAVRDGQGAILGRSNWVAAHAYWSQRSLA